MTTIKLIKTNANSLFRQLLLKSVYKPKALNTLKGYKIYEFRKDFEMG